MCHFLFLPFQDLIHRCPILHVFLKHRHSNFVPQRESIKGMFENFFIISLKMQAQNFPRADLS